ncbi:hypothetical protein A2410_00990 [Candidatus Shapirobacteria bacterium RIFOXYC1_FULL_38_24]|uniref:Uncharacterized protein n=3 Tax=Candidatus Shapironibacteriota TaxID=1752721 RepID=A0A0G0JNN3_9BACT|nr:MAG: hypothetical protein US90_C0018G0002 [Candidatus Shapirobacteria bacterium GW2011_GWE2_38_30]KKQ89862.1 MAG: hypothetical protein UT14_C0050G0003 [Candidatus Shapirobacteria bacterium GW2011_GWE1_38_92]OGL55992.1 MAG: hypothetical protein A2367_03065 [Candidatus Shapirobacteria bacterium RIFOXYB1_FULL_38_38]OGL56595.1 MAG: hypothetical protein A2410_00990 [Candidatus Shapirobacteria bacterium RIFOXYC1_FULL_38_24]HAP37924.1 hypothetical protein [Candidatus Shapirobacteria bacterium]
MSWRKTQEIVRVAFELPPRGEDGVYVIKDGESTKALGPNDGRIRAAKEVLKRQGYVRVSSGGVESEFAVLSSSQAHPTEIRNKKLSTGRRRQGY